MKNSDDFFATSKFNTDKELLEEYSLRLGLSGEDAKFLLDQAVESIRYLLKKNSMVNIRKLGLFRLSIHKRAQAYSPQAGRFVNIPLRYIIKFRPSGSIKSYVNGKVRDNFKVAFEIGEGKYEGFDKHTEDDRGRVRQD